MVQYRHKSFSPACQRAWHETKVLCGPYQIKMTILGTNPLASRDTWLLAKLFIDTQFLVTVFHDKTPHCWGMKR